MQYARSQCKFVFRHFVSTILPALLLIVLVACSNSHNNGTPGSAGPTGTPASGTTFVYAAIYTNGGGTGGVAGYSQNSAGALTLVSGLPFLLQSSTAMPALAAQNGSVYIASQATITSPAELIQFTADENSGALVQVNAVNAGTTGDFTLRKLLVSPSRNTMYGLFQFTIVSYALSATGLPSVLRTTAPSTDSVWGFDITPQGSFAYAAIQNGNSTTGFQTPAIHLLNVAADGSVADNRSVVTLTGALGAAGDLKIDPMGKFVIVSTGPNNNQLSVYSIQSDGTLSEVSGSPFSTGAEDLKFISFDALGKFLYVLNTASAQSKAVSLEVFSFDDSSGALAQVQSVNLTIPDQQASWLKVDGNFVYVTEVNNGGTSANITVYDRDPNTGRVTQASSTAVPYAIGETDTLHF